jgi:lysophospholipase L1-like esterase
MRRLPLQLSLLIATALLLVLATASSATAPAGVTVGLGDSFASGEGTPPYDDGTAVWLAWHPDTCHRSRLSWQRLLGVTASLHLACSGATIDNLTTRPSHRRAPDDVPQLARLRTIAAHRRVATVLVMVGGNDLGFASIVRRCVLGTCLGDGAADQRSTLRKLEPRLAALYRSARSAARGARVVVVGYPDIVPGPGSPRTGCPWLTSAEVDRIAVVEGLLDATLQRAAATAGATFVTARETLRGHELCTRASWVNPVAQLQLRIWRIITDAGQGHPTARGQQALADAVGAALASLAT